jgi:hypothetical protein
MTPKKKISQATMDEQYISTRTRDLEKAFSEMTETIDKYMRVSPLAFIDGAEAQPGEYIFKQEPYRFSNFDGWTERWLGALFPRSIENQQKIANGKAGDHEDLALSYDVQRLNFVLGYLVGCSSMGADRAALRNKAEAFIIQQIEHTRWELTQK